jgi:hypothetical protein
VAAGYTTYHEDTVDLLEFILSNRAKLILKPNDEATGQRTFIGAELDEADWDRAMKTALRGSYVVQEATPVLKTTFPVDHYGTLDMKDMYVDVHPHSFLGKVNGCSSWLTPAGSNGFSTLTGLAPTFILESK